MRVYRAVIHAIDSKQIEVEVSGLKQIRDIIKKCHESKFHVWMIKFYRMFEPYLMSKMYIPFDIVTTEDRNKMIEYYKKYSEERKIYNKPADKNLVMEYYNTEFKKGQSKNER